MEKLHPTVMKYLLLIPFYILILFSAFSSHASDTAYRRVDSIMRAYSKKINSVDELYKLTYFIRTNFDTDSLRLRASVIWITENIAYDVKAWVEEDPKAADMEYVLRKKKAICSGYANLLKYFCDAFEIENEIVTGHARNGMRGVVINQTRLTENHAWNSVRINGQWRLIDATWAAGGLTEAEEDKDCKFVRYFNEAYYFPQPEKLILNHFPKKNKHQQINPLVSEMVFKKRPLYTTAMIGVTSIYQVLPDSAILKVKAGDTITIRFRANEELKGQIFCGSVALNPEKGSHKATLIEKDGWYEFRYPVKMVGFYTLAVGYCGIGDVDALVTYRIEAGARSR